MILCADTTGRTSLYDAELHAVVTVPDLTSFKGRDAIPVSITRPVDEDDPEHGDSLYVISRTPDLDPDRREHCFEELIYGDGENIFNEHQRFRGWCTLPPPSFLRYPVNKLPSDIGAYTVVGGSSIYVSSMAGTYCFDTTNRKWSLAGNWRLPFFGNAEYVPELNLWFGLSDTRPYHLCAADLSALEFKRPPAILHTWADFDMPNSWSPFQQHLINLGAGRFCVAKIFHSTQSRYDYDGEDDEAYDFPDLINWEFAVLTGVEVVSCHDGEAPSGKLRMIKHMSRYHIFKDDTIMWVL